MPRKNFAVRLDDAERERLDRLAFETGRTTGSVFRLLLSMSDIPEVRRRLGLGVSLDNNYGVHTQNTPQPISKAV